VDKRDALLVVANGVFNRGAHQTLGSGLRNGLDADADAFRVIGTKANFLVFVWQFAFDVVENLVAASVPASKSIPA
jgi:uncharacterized membrane protein